MKQQELDLRPIPTGKVLFRLTLLGCLLLGCVYGFILLFNTALEAMKEKILLSKKPAGWRVFLFI